MLIVNKTKFQLYADAPLFSYENMCLNKMSNILQDHGINKEPIIFKTLWDNVYINKFILDNYNWSKAYEFWQIHQFKINAYISLYDFIKLSLYGEYFKCWEKIVRYSIKV